MEAEFAALAEQVTNEIPEALGSVVVSPEGRAVGAFPAHTLDLLEPHAVKLSRLPDAKRSFLEFGGSSLFSVSRPRYTVVIVTPQAVDSDEVLAAFEAVMDRLEGSPLGTATASPPELVLAEPAPAPAPAPTPAPTTVASPASNGAEADVTEEPPAATTSPAELENPVGLAQQFSSLLQENFGEAAEPEASEAEAAS